MELSDSGEALEANEFALESYTLGSDEVFPEEVRNPAIGEKVFQITMSAKVVEFHRLTGSSLVGTTFPKIWIRRYDTKEDESREKMAEYSFDNARPTGFQLKSDFRGLSGLITFVYKKAEVG